MANFRGMKMPGGISTNKLRNIQVKKSVDLTDYLDRGNITDDVVPPSTAGSGHRKGSDKGSAVSKTTSMGSITDTHVIEDHDFGEITTQVENSQKISWTDRRKSSMAAVRARGGND